MQVVVKTVKDVVAPPPISPINDSVALGPISEVASFLHILHYGAVRFKFFKTETQGQNEVALTEQQFAGC